MNDDNEPMSAHQRQTLLNFADKLEIFVVIVQDMRRAQTVGEGKRLLKKIDELADALMQSR